MWIVGSVDQSKKLWQQGLTLIELMITVVVIAVLLLVAVPNMSTYWQESKLVSASEAVYSNIHLVRSVALARNQEIHVTFGNTGGTNWCMALSEDDSCDCAAGTSCTLTNMPTRILNGSDYGNITLSTNFPGGDTSVQMPRGTMSSMGHGDPNLTGDRGQCRDCCFHLG